MAKEITREEAWALLTAYNKEPFHLKHGETLELKSVKKKYKALNFAAGCSREVIQRGADMLGRTLDDLISDTILAMRTLEKPQAE